MGGSVKMNLRSEMGLFGFLVRVGGLGCAKGSGCLAAAAQTAVLCCIGQSGGRGTRIPLEPLMLLVDVTM